jgi:hypothetical protein
MMQQTAVWAAFCLTFLAAATRWPHRTRLVSGAFFLVMALGVNIGYALLDPDGFVRLGTDAPLLPPYAWTFSHVVSLAPATFGVAIAAYEITAGWLMLHRDHARWGLLAGISFLVLSAPLGPWSLPNLILAAALMMILRQVSREAATADRQPPVVVPHPAG